MGLLDPTLILDAEMPETASRSPQHAQPVLGGLHIHVGVRLPIHYHHVAQVAIGVTINRKTVVEEGAIGVEAAIADGQGNVVGRIIAHELLFIPLGGGLPPTRQHFVFNQIELGVVEREPEARQTLNYIEIG